MELIKGDLQNVDDVECALVGADVVFIGSLVAVLLQNSLVSLAKNGRIVGSRSLATSKIARSGGAAAPRRMVMRLVIAGGAGFIGSNIARTLAAEYEVVALDDHSVGRAGNLAGVAGVELVRASILDADLQRRLAGADAVVNCAVADILVSQAEPVKALRVNGEGTLRLLDAARSAGIKRFIQCSSGSVYGESQTGSMREDDVPAPLGPYGLSKLVGEHYALWHARHHPHMPVTVLRFFNVYGPNQSPENTYCQVVSLFLSRALDGEPITVHGDGLQTRDFTYVGDVVDVIQKSLEGRVPSGEPFNVATGVQTTIKDLAALAQEVTGRTVPVRFKSHEYPEHVRRRCPSTEKLWKAAGWRVQVPLKEGLRRTADWLAKERTKVGQRAGD